MTLIFKVMVFFGFFSLLFATAFGGIAATPGMITLPILLFALMIPMAAFAFVSNRIIFLETIRKVRNRGLNKFAGRIVKDGKNMDHVRAKNVNLSRLNMEGFSLRHAALENLKMIKARAKGIDFSQAFLPKAKMSLGHFRNARFHGANLNNGRLRYGNFKNADFSEASLKNCNLKGADLSGANLQGADLERAVINDKTILPISREDAIKRGAIAV